MAGNLVVTGLSRQSIDKTLHFVFLLSCRFHSVFTKTSTNLISQKEYTSSCSLLMSKTKIKQYFVSYNLFQTQIYVLNI